MLDAPSKRPVLLNLAAEGIIPVLGGCAGALAGGPEGGIAGIAAGQVVEKVVNFFGGRIVQRWCAWFRDQPPEVREQAVAELATLTPAEARHEVSIVLERIGSGASVQDIAVAIEYLSLLPGALDRALLPDTRGGRRTLPPTVTLEEPGHLLALLPMTLPPYPAPGQLPGTPYHLDQLLGVGGFGAVYRASTRSLQHLPLAIKFCHDPALVAALQRERDNLERLMKAADQGWSARIVRLYGYDLEHRTPYLVYEYVRGGDLSRQLAARRKELGRPLNPDEVLGLVLEITEALAVAHRHGLVHRDLKPANILVDGDTLKLADFGLGGVSATRAAQVSRIGAATVDMLTVAEQASLFRGAGTPLYMAPEQRRGAPADPRHDLYSLGVMWFQMLAGDVSRELHPGWAKELTLRYGVPRGHIDLIEACVGWFDERPQNAGELLPRLRALRDGKAPTTADPTAATPAPAALPEARPVEGVRHELMVSLVRRLDGGYQELGQIETIGWRYFWPAGVLAVLFMTFGASVSRSSGVVLVLGGLGFAVGVFTMYLVRLGRRAEVRERMARAMRSLEEEFPAVVHSWGGPGILRHAETVRQMADRLGIPPPNTSVPPAAQTTVSPTAAKTSAEMPALTASQREELAGKLRALSDAQAELARRPEPRPFHPWVALAVSGVLGALAGLGVVGLYHAYLGPFRFGYEYFNKQGRPLTAPEYRRIAKEETAIGASLGVLTGLVVLAIVFWLLSRWRWYRRPTAVAVAISVVVLGLPVGLGVGFLHDSFLGPFREGWNYYNYRGTQISQVQYHVEFSESGATSAVLGVAAGLLVVLSAMVIFLIRYHRRRVAARRRHDELLASLVADFPRVVQDCGGAATLAKPDALRELLVRLESRGAQPTPG